MSMSIIITHQQPPSPQPTHQETVAAAAPSSKRKNKKKRSSSSSSSSSFIGVRKRAWGRYVSEIRLPGEKTRIWLGSFASPEMAALAHDSAASYLKGPSAALNFPHLLPSLPRPLSSSRRDIQSAAAKAAALLLNQHQTTSSSSSSSSAVEWDYLESLFEEEIKEETSFGVEDYFTWNPLVADFDFNHDFLTVP
ncbi:hypothetical protein RIF29_32816 [Crotalaria pallida]|uniref:AP2/ERF domain-containing protein n=1 Tax=Crotalaria pallida TaxID=3830 RepID=A0AAN9EJB3_CROPI